MRFRHPCQQPRNLLPFSNTEADGTNKGSVQGVGAQGFRKLAEEKLQKMKKHKMRKMTKKYKL